MEGREAELDKCQVSGDRLRRMNRRELLQGAVAGAATLAWPTRVLAASADLKPVFAEVDKRHDEAVKRLQEWIHQPSIAAENRGMTEGCDLMIRLLKDAGFQRAERVPTDGQPGVFATLDAGAPRTVALYFMYDVKQVDPAEWSSPPWDAAIVDKPGIGKAIVGRGAVNQKGPESAFLAALHGYRGANRKLPVNLVFVAEGEEEIGSPHFPQIVHRPDIQAALSKCTGRLHALRHAGPGRQRHGDARGQGCRRGRADLERRTLGPRPAARHPLEQQGARGQPRLAPRAGAQHARHSRRKLAGDRGVHRARPADLRRPRRRWSPRGRGGSTRGCSRSRWASRTGSTTSGSSSRSRGSCRSPRSTSRGWSAATRARAGRPSSRTRRSPSSTCGWCRT